jgi:hypothetical protein
LPPIPIRSPKSKRWEAPSKGRFRERSERETRRRPDGTQQLTEKWKRNRKELNRKRGNLEKQYKTQQVWVGEFDRVRLCDEECVGNGSSSNEKVIQCRTQVFVRRSEFSKVYSLFLRDIQFCQDLFHTIK